MELNKNINKYKKQLILIILFIFIDLTGIMNLWNENIYRRLLHHLQNSNYTKRKIPWIKFPNNKLTSNEIKYFNYLAKTVKSDCFE